ncbi:MAG: hypothetical protein IMF26_03240 [Candidatus Fermentithermobacillus carboniphilus]|uniref:DUF6504 domain-containing protein n=1 Tax=Candidatus Fermentithermobacillus carboniphilus TaxID=3085328 RepID=A0AAT9LDJ5_9FIRM|nr:MAG: hypothetical protein IMF26_03240 [Candidatus Fermentithermobacillus carboniphilus]
MDGRFIGKVVPVEVSQEIGFKRPVSFTWDSQVYRVTEILLKWEDYGFGQSPPKNRHWWLRRHRTYYHVLTDSGRIFELYYDRASKKPSWVLVKEIASREM